jgi:type IV pilus assembly protein PilM
MLSVLNKISQKHAPIGLDIGADYVRMIQLGHPGETATIIAADQFAVNRDADGDQQAAIASAIEDMLARTPFSRTSVVSCLSNDFLKIKSIRLDAASPDSIDKMLAKEAPERFDINPDRDEIRYIIAGSIRQAEEMKNEVIIFAAEKSVIASHLQMLEDVGLDPIAIDTAPCALFRCLHRSLRRQEDKELVSVFVDVADSFTTVIIGRGRQIAFVKQIPIAAKQLNGQVAESLGITPEQALNLRSKLKDNGDEQIDPATRQAVIDAMRNVIEELAKEVSLCFKYYSVTFRGQRPQEAFFTGAEAYETALLNALKRHLGVEITIAQPLRGFDLSQTGLNVDKRSSMCEWALPVGLSIKGWNMTKDITNIFKSNKRVRVES